MFTQFVWGFRVEHKQSLETVTSEIHVRKLKYKSTTKWGGARSLGYDNGRALDCGALKT